MSVQRSPPGIGAQPQLQTPCTTVHYNSDSALNNNVELRADYFNITKRQKRTFGGMEDCPVSSISEIKNTVDELKDQQDKKFEFLTNALSTIMAQNEGIQKSVAGLVCQNEDLLLKINNLEQENCEYKKRVSVLETKVDYLEKGLHASTIEIRNIPKINNEKKQDIIDIIQNLGSTLGLETPIQMSEIKEAHRTRSDAITVNFTTTLRKESIISKLKSFNKFRREKNEPQLNTEHIKIPGAPRAVYISEYLTKKTKRVFYVARENVRNKKLAAAWTSFGKVYVKKAEGDSPFRIDEESEIDKLLS